MHLRWLYTIAFLCVPLLAFAAPDFSPQSDAWNGLEALRGLATSAGYPVEIPEKVLISRLDREDSLLIIHPTSALPVSDITAFLRRGGRVAIADDRGSASDLLDAFQISRDRPAQGAVSISLRDNPELLIARPTGAHPLTQDVRAIATNHTAVLHHAALEPVFVVAPQSQAIMLAGAVGQGRLIAIADSSIFINNMLELEGNQQLARNLLRYLREDHPGRFIWVIGATPLTASVIDRIHAPLDGLRSLLQRVSNVALPPALVMIVAISVIVFAFLFAASHVPARSPYAKTALFARAPIIAGFAGRVAFFRRHQTNLLQPLMAFKIELEAELLHRLSAHNQLLLREVVDAIAKRGGSSELCNETRTLLVQLDDIATQHERATEPPLVNARKFHDMVTRGERILAGIARLE